MHHRFLLWFFVGALLGSIVARAQPAIQGGAERVLVARVVGQVQMKLGADVRSLQVDDQVPQSATILTGRDASVVLVFSNGASTQLGSETELVIEEFLQDPFASTVKVAELAEEPSRSRTRLALKRGELVGNVKKLQHANGSSFTVTTPVGAAGIRGTTFRIVFRPAGTGQAFGATAQPFQFSLTTLEGDVGFQQTVPGTPGTGMAVVPNVAVTTGQEIVVTVSVTLNPQGQFIVAAAPQVVGTSEIPPATAAQMLQAAQQIISASTNTSFSPPPGGAPPPPPAPPAPRTTPLSGDR